MPDCIRHMNGKYSEAACPICKMVAEVSEIFARFAPRTPSYRFWRLKRGNGRSERTFEYTTETAEGGKYWAVERRWVRVKGGERGKIVRKAGFKLRRKAKAKAYEWYKKATAKQAVDKIPDMVVD